MVFTGPFIRCQTIFFQQIKILNWYKLFEWSFSKTDIDLAVYSNPVCLRNVCCCVSYTVILHHCDFSYTRRQARRMKYTYVFVNLYILYIYLGSNTAFKTCTITTRLPILYAYLLLSWKHFCNRHLLLLNSTKKNCLSFLFTFCCSISCFGWIYS